MCLIRHFLLKSIVLNETIGKNWFPMETAEKHWMLFHHFVKIESPVSGILLFTPSVMGGFLRNSYRPLFDSLVGPGLRPIFVDFPHWKAWEAKFRLHSGRRNLFESRLRNFFRTLFFHFFYLLFQASRRPKTPSCKVFEETDWNGKMRDNKFKITSFP